MLGQSGVTFNPGLPTHRPGSYESTHAEQKADLDDDPNIQLRRKYLKNGATQVLIFEILPGLRRVGAGERYYKGGTMKKQ